MENYLDDMARFSNDPRCPLFDESKPMQRQAVTPIKTWQVDCPNCLEEIIFQDDEIEDNMEYECECGQPMVMRV